MITNTLYRISSNILAICDDHLLIDHVAQGSLDQVDENVAFTGRTAWLIHNDSSLEEGAVFHNFNLILLDVELPDRSNEGQIQSDMLQVGIDIVGKLNIVPINKAWIDLTNVTITPFVERFKDYVAGVTVGFSVKALENFDVCSDTFAGAYFPTSNGQFILQPTSYLTCTTLNDCPSFIAVSQSAAAAGGGTPTGSLLVTGSVSSNTLTFTKGDGSTFDLTVATGSVTPTGSLLVTASVSSNIITFTKGDGSTFPITVATGSTAGFVQSSQTGSFATTGSNIFIGNQIVSGSINVSGSIVMQNGQDIITHHVKAPGTNGVEIQNNNGGVVGLFGAGGSQGTTFYGQVNATAFSGSGALVYGVISSSYATTASYVQNAQTASYVLNAESSSFATTASFISPNNALIAGLPYVVYNSPAAAAIATSVDFTINTSQLRNGSVVVLQGYMSRATGTGTVTFSWTANSNASVNSQTFTSGTQYGLQFYWTAKYISSTTSLRFFRTPTTSFVNNTTITPSFFDVAASGGVFTINYRATVTAGSMTGATENLTAQIIY